MKAIFALTLVTMLGCASTPQPEDTPSPVSACNAEKAQSLVGQPASAGLAQQAQSMSGARATRWLQPGQITTREYRADRLNIELDAHNQVIAIRCG
jgi:hypothetical protein